MSAARLYKCPDPDCPGYPKGHRHKLTCATYRYMRPAWRRGAVLGAIRLAQTHVRSGVGLLGRTDEATHEALATALRTLHEAERLISIGTLTAATPDDAFAEMPF